MRGSTTGAVVRLGRRHLFGTYRRLPVAFARGEGVRLRDLEGREYLDFLGGIAVSSLGHGHPELVGALRDQVGRLLHVSNLYHVPEQAEAGRALTELSGMDRVFFCNSGTEAVEAAIKLSRKWGRATKGEEAYEIVVADGAFHGRTLGALAATANPTYREPFRPLPGGFRRVPFGDLEAAGRAVGRRTCAVLIEPIQGESGIVPARPGYLRGLESLARRHGALFVLDEVQTGVGRTGAPFAFQRYGVTPDAVALAKGLGGGVPVGALLARREVARHLVPGDHASTFGGNPLASRAVSAVLGVLRREELWRNAEQTGLLLRERLEAMARDGLPVEAVRGMGLLLGFDVPGIAGRVADGCLDEGLLVNAIGDSTIRLAPPLIVTRDDADRAMAILRSVLRGTASTPAGAA